MKNQANLYIDNLVDYNLDLWKYLLIGAIYLAILIFANNLFQDNVLITYTLGVLTIQMASVIRRVNL